MTQLSVNDINDLISSIDRDLEYSELFAGFTVEETKRFTELRSKLVLMHYESKMQLHGHKIPLDFDDTYYDSESD